MFKLSGEEDFLSHVLIEMVWLLRLLRFIDSRCLLKKCVTIDVYGGGLSVDGSKRNCFSLSVNT